MSKERVLIPKELLRECQELMRYPAVHAAFTARMNGILDTKMEMLVDNDKEPDTDLQQIILRHLVPQIRDIAFYLVAFGVCPYQLMQVQFDASKNPKRAKSFEGQAVDQPYSIVPCIPEVNTYDLYVKYDDLQRKQFEFRVRETYDKERILSYERSLFGSGPEYDCQCIDSPIGTLLESWRALKQRRREYENMLMHIACPPIYLESAVHSGVELESTRNIQAAAETASHMQQPNQPEWRVKEFIKERMGVIRIGDLHQNVAELRTGGIVDEKGNVLIAPMGWKFANVQPPRVDDHLLQLEEAFLRNVSMVLEVPMTYLSGAAKVGALQDSQSMIASDNDRRRYADGVDKMQRDVMNFLSLVYEELMQKRVTVTVPTRVDLTIEEVKALREQDMFDDETTRHMFANAARIHENHLKTGPISLKPIEYEPPKPATK